MTAYRRLFQLGRGYTWGSAKSACVALDMDLCNATVYCDQSAALSLVDDSWCPVWRASFVAALDSMS